MSIMKSEQFSKDELEDIFQRARYIRECPGRYTHELDGKIMGTLFFEPSTRTRMSFEAAMLKLGGSVICGDDNSSLKKGEAIYDMVKCVSQYADVLVIRHKDDNVVIELEQFSDCPIINGGSGALEHPTQGLLDVFTMIDLIKKDKIKVLLTGDLIFSRTIRSLLPLLHLYNHFEIFYAMPEWVSVKEHEEFIAKMPYKCISENKIHELLPEIDVLYMTRKQTERHNYSQWCHPHFVLTTELADLMKKEAIILHPLPSLTELPHNIANNPRAKYFEQAKNGMWIRMALLWQMLRKVD